MSVDDFSLGVSSLSTSAMCGVCRSYTQATPGLYSNADVCVCGRGGGGAGRGRRGLASMVFKMHLVSSDYSCTELFQDPLGQIF